MIRILSAMRTTGLLCALAAACLPLVLVAAGCDEASPVAPPGTTLSISVSPSQIAANGTATVRVTALKANGTPVNPGTEVRLETTRGSVDPIVETDSSGVAEGTLRGDGRVGMATVTARTGSAEPAMVDVEIGEFASSISLQATPAQVTAGGTVDLLAIVRDDEGEPLQGATVNFTTQVGTLDSRGAIVRTNANGQARDRLRVSEADLDGLTSPTFTVTAIVGGEGGEGGSASVMIRALTGEPVARFIARPGSLNEVIFDNQSEGAALLMFEWNFGDMTPLSNEESPVHDYNQTGSFRVRLSVTNDLGQDNASCQITVPLMDSLTCVSESS